MRRLRHFLRDDLGGALVEMTLVFPLVLILTFGLAEFGVAFWEYHTAEKATAAGARWLATRYGVAGSLDDSTARALRLYTATVPDCFVANPPNPPGTSCAQVAGSTSWSQSCTGSSCSNWNSSVMTNLLTEMRRYAPFIRQNNVTVQLSGSALGFVGRGRAVPFITVRTTGLTYSFSALTGLLGFSPLTMPSFATTLPAEDEKEGPGV